MNIQRAHQIADSFSGSGALHVNELSVEELSSGLLVRYQGHSCYFVRESCFWPFVFKSVGTSLREVAEIELKLAA
ncbi:MAG: hypothetical protein R8K53_05190 [Mariprofundaceae bacterium]